MNQINFDRISDLVTDKSFVEWVKSPDKVSGGLDYWIKTKGFTKEQVSLAREVITRMNFQTTFPGEEKTQRSYEKILMNINSRSEERSRNKISWRKGRMYPAKVAAVVLIFLVSFIAVYWLRQHSMTEDLKAEQSIQIIKRTNPSAIKSKIILPDGSTAWLNSESELTYPERFSEVREVTLKGEAYFNVTKNTARPFVVKTDLSKIKVLGTRFNVNAYHEKKERDLISLVEGKVAVSMIKNDTSSLLLPGEQIEVDRDSGISRSMGFDSLEITGWTQGWLVFKDANQEEIIDKLSRWYGVNFILLNEPAKEWHVNGYFQNQTLEMVLDRLSFSKDFRYVINDKTVKIEFI